jgi:pyridoxamine 5'-phosphate oxidase
VSSRIVLLRYFDEQGFVFFSGYKTGKAAQMAENVQVALLFPWLSLERQVKIKGRVEKIAASESLRFFATRSREWQLGAWLTQTSEAVSSRGMLKSMLQDMKDKFGKRRIPLPDAWGGYRVRHRSIEFWQGHTDGLHDRFLYSVREDGWHLERLIP